MSFVRPRRSWVPATLVALGLAVAGCGTGSRLGHGDQPSGSGLHDVLGSTPATPTVEEAVVRTNVRRGATDVPVDRRLRVTAEHGQLTSVSVHSKTGAVTGRISGDGSTWTAGALLEPGTTYTVTTVAQDANGTTVTKHLRFTTQPLTLDQQTFPSFAPLSGQTVGVGMPVIVRFDVPVTDHASIEKHLQVVSRPAQRGSWHWISDNEVHWRPASYWKPGTEVTVNADINGVPAGNGIYGQLDRSSTFRIGASHIYKVDIRTDQLRVFDNGHLTRTIPVTTGQQPDFTTRSGTKVIVEKLRRTRMNSETIGIDPHSANGYNLNNVEYAMRLTYSGEFLHAAPWSVYAQGHENVSHGCTGMSTANAGWLYRHSLVGDVVEYTGSSKQMTLTNGYGDWNESFSQYKTGSALS